MNVELPCGAASAISNKSEHTKFTYCYIKIISRDFDFEINITLSILLIEHEDEEHEKNEDEAVRRRQMLTIFKRLGPGCPKMTTFRSGLVQLPHFLKPNGLRTRHNMKPHFYKL